MKDSKTLVKHKKRIVITRYFQINSKQGNRIFLEYILWKTITGKSDFRIKNYVISVSYCETIF